MAERNLLLSTKSRRELELEHIESQRSFGLTRQKLVFQDLDNGQLITKDVSPPLGSDGQSLLRKNISLTKPTRLNNAFNNFTYPKEPTYLRFVEKPVTTCL